MDSPCSFSGRLYSHLAFRWGTSYTEWLDEEALPERGTFLRFQTLMFNTHEQEQFVKD